jgi:hypothetical protein
MSAYQSKLALGQMDEMLELIQETLPVFIADNTWQEMCREWVLRASGNGEIPVPVEEVGSEWAKNYAIDVAGISESATSLVLGDCFWTEGPLGVSVVEELVQKTATIVPKNEQMWSVYYVVFSAQGWTEEAKQQAEEMIADGVGRRKRWHPVGIKLIDLAELDADLIRWST